MGARLVGLVLARWTHLPDRAFRVAVRMALTALDEPTDKVPAATYFGGRDALANVLRNERGGTRDSVLRVVRLAIEDLIDAGAAKRVSKGRVGNNAVYELTLLNTPKSIGKRHCTVEKEGETSVPPEGETGIPPQGETSIPQRGNAAFPPRNHDEPREDPQEEVRLPVPPVLPAVDTTGGAPPPDPRRPDDPSGRRTSPETATSAEEQQPPQPETATHDRAHASDPPPALRLVPGNPDAIPTDERTSLFPAPVPGPPRNPLRRPDRAAQAIAEATARREAARAAHQAAQGETG
ncbi:hypothetical protein DER29_4319 [Micromonospora sp. M71_S20]|uniref:hypothetical protein n=1 Tax=Micromonospora sp. M71_S20 TaxID=592872 RepID=UPI000EAB972B|nr:hypothetical protein [Micromonospora sp. M71_S20]RLK13302.1 hypothetical protein DER29_4319 [Micromonospora sp. M71_S20]